MTITLLILTLSILCWSVYEGQAEYASFKLLTDTVSRQRCYRMWVIKNFCIFFGGPLLGLLLLHRVRDLSGFPPEFLSLKLQLQPLIPHDLFRPHGFILGVILGAFGGGIGGGIALTFFLRKNKTNTSGPFGDIEAMMPRNNAETVWTTILSLNAGLSEECFFRLLLPLLFVLLFHKLLLAFILATLIFGIAHLYQGIAGILITTALGGAFAVLYLFFGNLWIAIAVHAAFDLVSLVIRPTVLRLIKRTPARIKV